MRLPVWKYKSFEEAERALWLPTCDPRLAKKIAFVWDMGWSLAGRFVPPRGVFKFRSIEEANAHRDAWEKERVARIQERSKDLQRTGGKSTSTRS